MTLPKPKLKNLVLVAIIFPISGVVLTTFFTDSCGIKHFQILNDIEKNNQDFDPEFCEEILFKIDDFNDRCEPDFEILDCG